MLAQHSGLRWTHIVSYHGISKHGGKRENPTISRGVGREVSYQNQESEWHQTPPNITVEAVRQWNRAFKLLEGNHFQFQFHSHPKM